jgi:lysozyme
VPASAESATKSAMTATPATPESASAGVHPVSAPVPAIAALAGPKRYAVKQGDTLTSIAKSAGVSVAEMETANSLKPASMLHVGQPLILPAKGAARPSMEMVKLDTAPKKSEDPAPLTAARTYTVKGGDRLLFIAKRFGVSPDELIAVNKIKDPAKLQIGQTLKIPTKKPN